MAIIENWKIRQQIGACTHSEKEFQDGDTFYTAIFRNEETEGYDRRDYSEESWEAISSSLEPFSYWKSKYEAPPEDDEPEMVKEDSESLLKRLMEEDNPQTENARFILAVMLERKKLIIETDVKETENDTKIRFYESRSLGDIYIIPDPNLSLDEVESVQEEVTLLLEGKEVEAKSEQEEQVSNEDTPEETS